MAVSIRQRETMEGISLEELNPTGRRSEAEGVSILIATDRRLEKLRRCIQSLHTHIASDKEIIVVDNDPARSARTICLDFPDILYAAPVLRLGVAAARNLGARLASFPNLLVIDDDAYVESDVCDEALRMLNEDPKCAAVALCIIDVPTANVWPKADPAKAVPGCGGVFRRSAFTSVGPQRESFRFGAEEIDWGVRCYNAGFHIRYARSSVVFHDPAQSRAAGERLPDYKIRNNLQNRLLFLFYNFTWKTVLLQGSRVCISNFVLGLRYRTLRPFCEGLLGALRAGWSTRRQRVLVSGAVDEFYTKPNFEEDEYSIPYWRKLVGLLRGRANRRAGASRARLS